MTTYERLINFLTFTFEKALFYLHHLPKQRELYKKYFPNAKRSLDDVLTRSAIIFMNTHVSATSARPNMPNVIEINGIHVKAAKKLPKDIQEFLDSATEGAIVFSLGSIIQAHKLPVEKREAFVKSFGKLKQKVIWKYENDTLPDKTDNVMISKWLPQRDILAHPNIRLFITHGGGLGTTEATAQGVPFIGIPVYGDQMV
jgi:glucuronosyltransferase